MNSFIRAFANITLAIKEIADKESQHLLDLCLIGFKIHYNFFENYKQYLYEGIVSMVMAVYFHQGIFITWLKKLSIMPAVPSVPSFLLI